jgi:hypothetical protein
MQEMSLYLDPRILLCLWYFATSEQYYNEKKCKRQEGNGATLALYQTTYIP